MKNIINAYLYILLFWISPCIIFLGIYYANFYVSKNIIIIHFSLIFFSLVFYLALLRIVNIFIYNKVRWINFLLSFIWFSLIFSIYSTMLLGLFLWGRIPTYNILLIYISQLIDTIKVINVPTWFVFMVFFVFLTFLLAISFFSALLIERVCINENKFKKMKLFMHANLLLLLAAVGIVNVWFYGIVLPGNTKEPLHQLISAKKIDKSSEYVLLEVIGNRADERLIKKEIEAQESYIAKAKNKPKSIVLITADALRPDRMGIYGYERQTTPFLQKLKDANQAHIVKEARSACPESTCGLLSLLSGKQVYQLLPSNFNLSEILGLLGYQRFFLLSGDHTHYYGLKESYGSHELYWDGTHNPKYFPNDDWGLLEAVNNFSDAKKEEHYFFFIHLMSAHGIGKKHPEFAKWLPAQSIYNLSIDIDKNIESFYNNYDNGVLQVDFVIHSIYSTLIEKGYINDSSIVLLTADHGESLGEHGVRTHAHSLYDAEIRIPWVWLGRAVGSLTDPVVQADFAPTVLTDIGALVPGHWSGLPLQNGTQGREFTFHMQIPYVGIIQYTPNMRNKLIIDKKNKSRVFFDLKNDPKELFPQNINIPLLEKHLEDTGLLHPE